MKNNNAEPNCPRCGSEMRQRENHKTGNKFWGCSQYPDCTGTLPDYYQDREVLSRAAKALVSVCDGANSIDGQGFGKFDVQHGRELAHRSAESWDGNTIRAAYYLLFKYRKQLATYHGIDLAGLNHYD